MKIGALDRRSLAIALAFGVATAVAGCGSKEEPTPAASTPPPAAVAPAEPAAAPTPVAATDVADKTWTAEALEDLLAPIALYPDPVLPDAALRRLDSVETRAAIAMPEGPSIVILREQVAAFTGCKILRAEGNARIAMDQLAGQRVIAFRSLNLYSCAASWFTDRADRLLELHRIGRVAANPAPHPESASPGGWPGFVYYRLHGSPRRYWSVYERDRLSAWAQALQKSAASASWCIFDNTAGGGAVQNALELAALVQRRATR